MNTTMTKRKYPIVAWPLKATYATEDGEYISRTVDVSDGGALLSVENGLEPGTAIKVKFQIDNFEVGPEKAQVVRNDSAFGGGALLLAVKFDRPHPGLATAAEYDREKKKWRNSSVLR